ncbi:MAG: hypothetical protein GX367_04330 [Bacteroidales bacterium]|nr:hypothetical protein [Bacteroidales bacterium]
MKSKYPCYYCGIEYSSLRNLTSGGCLKNPTSKNHIPYEGAEQSNYVCKYCGISYLSIRNLTSGGCSKNPQGKCHEPLR